MYLQAEITILNLEYFIIIFTKTRHNIVLKFGLKYCCQFQQPLINHHKFYAQGILMLNFYLISQLDILKLFLKSQTIIVEYKKAPVLYENPHLNIVEYKHIILVESMKPITNYRAKQEVLSKTFLCRFLMK